MDGRTDASLKNALQNAAASNKTRKNGAAKNSCLEPGIPGTKNSGNRGNLRAGGHARQEKQERNITGRKGKSAEEDEWEAIGGQMKSAGKIGEKRSGKGLTSENSGKLFGEEDVMAQRRLSRLQSESGPLEKGTHL